MTASSPRTNLPEPLSGLPEPAVVELGHQRPWLTLTEANRLLRQHEQLAPSLARAWVLDELLAAIPLTPEREQELLRDWEHRRQLDDPEALARWLHKARLSPADLPALACRAERLARFRQHRWGDEVEMHYLRRKAELDRVVYSLLRVPDRALADELHQRIAEGEADFTDLAVEFSTGQERHTRGVIGPLPMAMAHAEIASRLRIGQPGQLWPPFPVADVWVVLRLEERLPTRLNSETRSRMMEELFKAWLDERVELLLAGEPLPALPAMPAATEVLPSP
ncbi:peptidyl-prolyl cis-trans isomerase [Synechococcus sp. GreenBA-s]|nr:peptidyl-prolyl cis-trans isomerase [Synechococcus sp. GreenBA-s]